MRFITRFAVVAVMIVAGTVFTTAPAQASAPPGDCVTLHDGNGFGVDCFEPSGDSHWVLDNSINGWRVGIRIETNYGKVRWCVDDDGAGNGWTKCNFDHREGTLVRTRMYEQNGDNGPTRNWTAWSRWVSTS